MPARKIKKKNSSLFYFSGTVSQHSGALDCQEEELTEHLMKQVA